MPRMMKRVKLENLTDERRELVFKENENLQPETEQTGLYILMSERGETDYTVHRGEPYTGI